MGELKKGRIPIRARLQKVNALPPAPAVVSQILAVKTNPNAGGRELVAVVNQDPSLAAEILRMSSSAYYGYRGEVNLLEVAINQVLGYELALDLALAIAVLEPLRIPQGGPMGEEKMRGHAVLCGATCQELAYLLVPEKSGVKHSMAFLVGLLHDIGFLVLGSQFPRVYNMLAHKLELNPGLSAYVAEQRMLDANHCELGYWLAEAWDLPPPVVVAVREHHNADYEGEQAGYAQLVYLADQLLGFDGNGKGSEDGQRRAMERLGIDQKEVAFVMANILSREDQLVDLARRMVAS